MEKRTSSPKARVLRRARCGGSFRALIFAGAQRVAPCKVDGLMLYFNAASCRRFVFKTAGKTWIPRMYIVTYLQQLQDLRIIILIFQFLTFVLLLF